MNSSKIVKTVNKYLIDREIVRGDSVVEYRKKGETDFKRGIVKYADQDSLKILRSVGTQESFSSTDIGRNLVEINVLIY